MPLTPSQGAPSFSISDAPSWVGTRGRSCDFFALPTHSHSITHVGIGVLPTSTALYQGTFPHLAYVNEKNPTRHCSCKQRLLPDITNQLHWLFLTPGMLCRGWGLAEGLTPSLLAVSQTPLQSALTSPARAWGLPGLISSTITG